MTMTTSSRTPALLPPNTTVVELGETIATALAGRFLQRLGASVTRILSPDESGLDSVGPRIDADDQVPSATAVWLREGKNTVVLDAHTEEGRTRVRELMAEADVVLIAGTTQQWQTRGIALADLRGLAANAVIGHVTPWGEDGARANWRSNELMLQAASGFLNLIGAADREPVRLGGHPLQSAAGLLVLDGVMIGLFHRQSTGQVSHFETSEFEASAHLEWKIASLHQSGHPIDRRGTENGPHAAPTRDGHFGLFFIPSDWEAVTQVLDDPRLGAERFATPRSRAHHEEELKAMVAETTRSMSKKDLYMRAQERRIPAGYVATMSDLLASPQYRARDFFQPVNVPGVGTGEIPDVPWTVHLADDDASTVGTA
jgi:crotonobetainyl-CoA:carnitine CoA-transferase CaiB-like acyl-CoA transferase